MNDSKKAAFTKFWENMIIAGDYTKPDNQNTLIPIQDNTNIQDYVEEEKIDEKEISQIVFLRTEDKSKSRAAQRPKNRNNPKHKKIPRY